VEALTTARSDLWRLEMDLDRYAEMAAAQRSEFRDRIAARRNDMTAALALYVALPSTPDKHKRYELAMAELASLDKQIAAYLARDPPPPLDGIRRNFHVVDEGLSRIVLYDADQGRRLGLEIQQIRAETRSIVVLLDAASVALALGAALLALRQLRRAARAHRAEYEARERRETALAAQNEALGEFAGRVAHDLLSPLTTATLSLELVQATCANEPATRQATTKGIAAVARVQALVDGLLAFSRAGGQPEQGAWTELAPVIADVTDGLSGQAAAEHIELRVLAVPEGVVACSKGVLISLLHNLVHNALKHMG